MDELTGAWSLDIPQLLPTTPLQHLARIELHPPAGPPIILQPSAAQLSTVTFNEVWQPHVQATLVCDLPPGVSLEAVDPRLGARATIYVGYVLPDGKEDLHPLADLTLQTCQADSPGAHVIIEAHSDELLIQRASALSQLNVIATGAREAIVQMATVALAGRPTAIAADLPAGLGAGILPLDPIPAGGSYWDRIASTADTVEAWVYDDGHRTLHITTRPIVAGVSRATLATGPGGLVTQATEHTSADEWANTVVVVHRWTDRNGEEQLIVGRATQETGPMSAATVGPTTMTVERPVVTTQAAADAEARAVLARALTRGRSETITAPACYWLRPGMTITRDTPARGRKRLLVSAATFELGTGLMAITTRDPEKGE